MLNLIIWLPETTEPSSICVIGHRCPGSCWEGWMSEFLWSTQLHKDSSNKVATNVSFLLVSISAVSVICSQLWPDIQFNFPEIHSFWILNCMPFGPVWWNLTPRHSIQLDVSCPVPGHSYCTSATITDSLVVVGYQSNSHSLCSSNLCIVH